MLFIHIGQCGVQLFPSLYAALRSSNIRDSCSLGSSKCLSDGTARSTKGHVSSFAHIHDPMDSDVPHEFLLLDTENKTLRCAEPYAKAGTGIHVVRISCSTSSGRGNNWAHGFTELGDLSSILTTLLGEPGDQRNVPTIPTRTYHTQVCVLHSVAGGTGSGASSALLAYLRASYGEDSLWIWSIPILPFSSGETALQNYNALLSISFAQCCADMITLVENDVVMGVLQKDQQRESHGRKGDESSTNLKSLNDYIALCVARLVCRVIDVDSHGSLGLERPFDGFELSLSCVPLPDCKFTSLHTSSPGMSILHSTWSTTMASPKNPIFNIAARGLVSWPDIATSIVRNIPFSERKLAPLASQTVYRGIAGPVFWQRYPSMRDSITKKVQLNTSTVLLPSTERFSSVAAMKPDKTESASITLLVNAPSLILPSLVKILQKAECMYNEGAYLHHYERFLPNVRMYFEDALAIVRDVIARYEEWSEEG